MAAQRHTLGSAVVLDGKYRIERVLGAGGFGITYEAEHLALQRRVAIKEYFPAELATRETSGEVKPRTEADRATFRHQLLAFRNEARAISQFDHPAIVRVLSVFEALGTVYLVMRYEEGPSLKGWIQDLGRRPTGQEIDRIARPLLDALAFIHAEGFLHRDIAPDNILLRPDLSPVLIDFGAARPIMKEEASRITGIVKLGYSPPEQYSTDSRQQGPWTDIYALAGTLYHCMTGNRPLEATERLIDDNMVQSLEAVRGAYRDSLLSAVISGLAVKPPERPQTIALWRAMFDFPPVEHVVPEARGARATEASASAVAGTDRAASAPPLPSPGRAERNGTPRPRSWRTPALAIVAIMLAGAAGAGLLKALRQEPDTDVSVPVSPPAPAPAPGPATRPIPAPSPPAATNFLIDLARGSFRDCAACPEMAIVPAGTFTMGSPDQETGHQSNEGPQQQIVIPRALAMARHETTRGEWRAFSDATSRPVPTDCRALQFRPELIADYEAGRARADWGANGTYSWSNTNYPQDDSHPAACISFADAEAYLAWMNDRAKARYRLPSEAEWEYAARAGTTTPFAFGTTVTPRDASYHQPSLYPGGETAAWRRGTMPVGSFAANRFGLFDMHGNVWEWVADCQGAALADLDRNAAAYRSPACEMAVMRGGAFWTQPEWIRSAHRYAYGKTLRGAAAGFRVARDLEDPEIRALQPLLDRLSGSSGAARNP